MNHLSNRNKHPAIKGLRLPERHPRHFHPDQKILPSQTKQEDMYSGGTTCLTLLVLTQVFLNSGEEFGKVW